MLLSAFFVLFAMVIAMGPTCLPAAEAATSSCRPAWTLKPNPAPGSSGLGAVTTAPGGVVWAVGSASGGRALIEDYTSSGWQVVPANVPAKSYLSSVSAAAANDIWAVGFSGSSTSTVTLIEHWNGSAWAQVPSPPEVGRLTGVLALGSNDAWAVGVTFTQTVAGVQFGALIEHWDGTSWSVVPDPDIRGTSYLNAIAGRSASALWAVGWQGRSGDQTLAEYWDGVDWRTVPTPNPPGRDHSFSAIAEISPTDAWAVGGTGPSALAEHWDGSAWKLVTTPDLGSPSFLTGVAAFGPRDVWAVGGYSTSAQGGTSSLAENWDGKTWSVVTMPNAMKSSRASAVTVLPGGSAWSVGYAYSAGASEATTTQICPAEITGAGFMPATAWDPHWRTVAWLASRSNRTDHAVVDGTGMGLFDIQHLRPGMSASFTFFASGTYAVTDPAPFAKETVRVPMNAWPLTGPPGATFSLMWASGPAPFHYVYDVQVEPPGDTQFRPLLTGISTYRESFTPADGPGTYRFEARLRNTSNGYTSSWSPTRTLIVTP
jgi:hypothetical protein